MVEISNKQWAHDETFARDYPARLDAAYAYIAELELEAQGSERIAKALERIAFALEAPQRQALLRYSWGL